MNKSALLTYCRWRKVFEFTPRNVTKCSTKASAIETLCPEESEVKRDADDVPILSMLGNGLDYDSARLYNHRVKSFYKNKLSLKLADDVPDLIRKLPASVKLLINQDDPELKSRYPEIFNYRTEAVEDCEESCDSGTPEELSYPFSHRHATTDSEIHDTFKKDVRDLMNDPKNSRMMQDYIASYMKILDAEDNDPKYYSFPDPTVPVSNVPCSGCGAHLHCKDEAFPGYVPSKRFLSLNTNQLRSETCHRCFFLKYYNMALNVNIAAEEYPTVISEIKNKNGLVMLMIDLMDFPCSIWPGIIDIIGKEHPICVVGNKVDLLPKDSPSYLDRVKSTLIQSLKDYGVDHGDNVKYVGLISAKSGYGIESLITKLKMAWKCKGDVYLIGCTNVGKSSLFNVLLQSDLCKRQACDIVPAATTSVWPGTTLNLLKFPMFRMTAYQIYERTQRLISQRSLIGVEEARRKESLRLTRDQQYATLIGHVTRTYQDEGYAATQVQRKRFYDPDDPEFRTGKFFYDTPGSVFKQQILDLLTTDELLKVLPKKIIIPRTFRVKENQTLFLAGLGRIDLLKSLRPIYLTVFSSSHLPVHIVQSVDADAFYKQHLGTKILAVPFGDDTRLADFPKLVGMDFRFTGSDWNVSCADVVLSSAGWISITGCFEDPIEILAYTPDGRGCFLRRPSLLPKAVKLRGRRIKGTPAYDCWKAAVL